MYLPQLIPCQSENTLIEGCFFFHASFIYFVFFSKIKATHVGRKYIYIYQTVPFLGSSLQFLAHTKILVPIAKKMSQPKFQRPNSILSAASKHFLLEKTPFFTQKWPFWGALRQYLKLTQGAQIFSSQTYVPECEKKWCEPPQLWFLWHEI